MHRMCTDFSKELHYSSFQYFSLSKTKVSGIEYFYYNWKD